MTSLARASFASLVALALSAACRSNSSNVDVGQLPEMDAGATTGVDGSIALGCATITGVYELEADADFPFLGNPHMLVGIDAVDDECTAWVAEPWHAAEPYRVQLDGERVTLTPTEVVARGGWRSNNESDTYYYHDVLLTLGGDGSVRDASVTVELYGWRDDTSEALTTTLDATVAPASAEVAVRIDTNDLSGRTELLPWEPLHVVASQPIVDIADALSTPPDGYEEWEGDAPLPASATAQPAQWADAGMEIEVELVGAHNPSGVELDTAMQAVKVADVGEARPSFDFDEPGGFARWGHVASSAPACDGNGCLALTDDCRDEVEVALAVDTEGASSVVLQVTEGRVRIEAYDDSGEQLFEETVRPGSEPEEVRIEAEGSARVGLRLLASSACVVGGRTAIVESIRAE